ncbi:MULTISPECIES: G5 and 3D domain-containing protein [Listeria]|uniref:G5 and 3D domain-containing protein n=1 Tax=Listeria TaxID=1637 RepID=UPI000B588418|nr:MULTISPECIES: G5 and 3D domain-containing protein [Listeria]
MTMENSSNVDQPSKWKLPILIAGFVIVVALVFYFVFEGTKNDITILNAGEKIEAKTHAATVGEALDESGIKLGAHDEVSPSKNTKIKDGMEIKFSNANQVNITDNGNETKVWSTKATVEELLKDENITTRPHDVVNVALDTKLKDGLNIKIDRAINLVLQNGAQKEQVWSTKANVGDLLEEKNIKLQKDDRVSPAKHTALKENMAILVTYVDKKAEEKTEKINFDTVYQNDASLEKGETKVVSAGKQGSKKVKYEVVLENGKEKARKRISESVVTKSENQVVARGTKAVQTVSVSHSSKSKASNVNRSSQASAPSGGKTFTMQSTAYTGGGRTATGINLSANPGLKVVAVDPSVIPLGSKVWVEGYGVAIAGDTGGAIKGNIVDVYFPDHGSCVNWGRRTVTVRVL